MMIQGFPGCCCAVVMKGFGESGTAASFGMGQSPRNVDDAKNYIRNQVRQHRAMGFSQIVLITNHEQTRVNDALTEMMEEDETHQGFLAIIYTPWMASRKHNTLIRTWILQLQPEPDAFKLRMAGVNNE